MIFVKHKPGEPLVLETRDGPIMIQVLPGNELAIEAPDCVHVASRQHQPRETWLPARPKLSVA